MMQRLVGAQVWRIRWHLLLLVVCGASSASAAVEPASVGTRLSTGLPLLMSVTAIAMLGIFWSREVRVLPISRRTALRSAWLSALALPIAITIGRIVDALVQVFLGTTGSAGIEALTLAAIGDVMFIGVGLTRMQRPDQPWAGVQLALRHPIESGKLLFGWLWLFVVPFTLPGLVPQALGDVTSLHLVVVLAAAVITAWPLVTTPDQWPMLGVLDIAQSDTRTERRRFERDYRLLDRLAGMPRLLPGPVGISLLVAASSLAASTALIYSLRDFESPFAAGMLDMEFFLIGGPLILLMLGPLGWTKGLTPFLRRLRALPVNATEIAATMTMLPLLIPVLFWILAGGVHLAIGVAGETNWRFGSLALLCGVSGLSAAVYARFNSVIVMMIGWGASVSGALVLMGLFDKATVEPVIAFSFPLIGLISVPAAFLLNYRTVTRSASSSAVYRPAAGESLYRGGV